MYNYGGQYSSCGCNGGYNQPIFTPYYGYSNNSSNYSIILVLFILLVIIIGARWSN